jgi:hypothetical protein
MMSVVYTAASEPNEIKNRYRSSRANARISQSLSLVLLEAHSQPWTAWVVFPKQNGHDGC